MPYVRLFSITRELTFQYNSHFIKTQYQILKTNYSSALSIVKIWHVLCTILSHSFSGRSGPSPLGLVLKILVVRSGPEGPQFTRFVGTLASVLHCREVGFVSFLSSVYTKVVLVYPPDVKLSNRTSVRCVNLKC